jgi:DNA-binding SARP family transcriptional activator/tetratricopeptide (TPR) repeat protein
MAVNFRLLGAVEARIGGQLVDIGHARQRYVLAVLLVEANRALSVDQLVDRLWPGHRPRHPRDTVYRYLSLLRKSLSPVRHEVSIVRQSGSYRLDVDVASIDLHRFRQSVARARTADDDSQAVALYEQAIGLWQGEAFGAVDLPWLNAVRETLNNERLAAELELTDLRLRHGHHTQLLPRLAELADNHPLDEQIAGQLMLALYRSGRQAQALEHYRQLRNRLVDELGTDPGPLLQRLNQQILTADPKVADLAATSGVPRTPVPRQLPAAPRPFVGRGGEFAALTSALNTQASMISAIGGAGGVGKTWLALHWAHKHIDRFPDGQLWVNLRGFDPTGRPMTPDVAVRGFLDALGMRPAAIPIGLDAQVNLYRSLVADKRILIVLDNAADTNQVIPLLPGGPFCTVLITSRHRLTSLVTTHGARVLDLDMFTEGEAREMLGHHLGSDAVNAEPQSVAGLLSCCSGLPLAISIVAARALGHPEFPLAVLAAELRDHAGRLDALDSGDTNANLRVVLSWSYNALNNDDSIAFALLGLVPGTDISLPAAASLIGQPIAKARILLRRLEIANLVRQHVPHRYRMHDLVHLYAIDRTQRDCPENIRSAAVRRVVDFYLHTAYQGQRRLNSHREPIEIDEPLAGCQPCPLADEAAAIAWFDAERSCLLAALQLAADHHLDARVWQLAWALNTFHQRRGHLHDDIVTWQVALPAAERLEEPAILCHAHRRLGFAYARSRIHTEALDHLHRSLALAEDTGDILAQAHTHHNLVWAWDQRGDDRKALTHATQALHLYQLLKTPFSEAQALNAVGWYSARLGDNTRARTCCEAALTLFRQLRYSDGEAATLDSLGYIAHHTDRYTDALDYYQQALAIRRRLGNSYDEASTLDRLGDTHTALGNHTLARDTWQQALRLYQAQNRTHDAAQVQKQLGNLANRG